MTDQTVPIDMSMLSAHHTSEAANRKLRKRHFAELRLKTYGILAIVLSGLALCILLYSVFIKAQNVVYEYYLALPTKIEVSERDRARIDDPNPRLRPSLNTVVRDALQETVGGDLDRRERRALFSLVSSDAGLELGTLVKNDPHLIGRDYLFKALMDDDAQLYLKGKQGQLLDAGSQGTLHLDQAQPETENPDAENAETDAANANRTGKTSNDGADTITLRFDTEALAQARQALIDIRIDEAERAERQAARQGYAVGHTQARLDEATTDDARQAIKEKLANFQAARDRDQARADSLRNQANDANAEFTLEAKDPSVLVFANGGWLKLVSLGNGTAKATILEKPESFGPVKQGSWNAYTARPESQRILSDREIVWLEDLQRSGKIDREFNWRLLNSADSSNAELAGLWGALVGSFWTMIITIVLAVGIGVLAAIYLEEFAPKNRLTDLIEININNLAAVPSIVFGLLGLTVLITGIHLGPVTFPGLLTLLPFVDDPRSSPLAGGVVLALMSLPTIIIAARASIRAVPGSLRDAALGLGASRLQTAFHHVLPLAMPGILTGSIIAMAQALGETAPLLMVGMNSFIQEPPLSPTDPANVLPTLIYMWNSHSERLFDDKTAAAIAVLLIFLILMNALAVILRKRFERRW